MPNAYTNYLGNQKKMQKQSILVFKTRFTNKNLFFDIGNRQWQENYNYNLKYATTLPPPPPE